MNRLPHLTGLPCRVLVCAHCTLPHDFCLRACVFACLLLVYCFAAWGRSHSFCLHLQLRAFPAQKKNPALRSVESFQVQQVWLTWIEPRLQAWLLLLSPREAFQRRGSTRRLGGKLLFLGNLNLAPSIGCPTRIPGTHSWSNRNQNHIFPPEITVTQFER